MNVSVCQIDLSPKGQLQALNVMMICLSPWLGKFCSMQFFSICLCVCLCFLPCCAVKKMSALILLYMLCLGMPRLQDVFNQPKVFFTKSDPWQIRWSTVGVAVVKQNPCESSRYKKHHGEVNRGCGNSN